MTRPACTDVDPELFFPTAENAGRRREAEMVAASAKTVCRRCPVRDACLQSALERVEEYGIFGGLDPDERRLLARRGGKLWDAANHSQTNDLHNLIACPTCHARVDETCKTESGRVTTPHGSRLVARKCACGGDLQPQRRLCDSCREKSLRESKRDFLRRRRADRKKVA